MTLLGAGLEALLARQEQVLGEARRIARDLLTPRPPLPRLALRRLLARSLRNGGWRRLTPVQRGLLVAAAAAPKKLYKSRLLVEMLRDIWLEVELATMRGRAIVAALVKLLSTCCMTVIWNQVNNVSKLVVIGVQQLNGIWSLKIA